MQRLLFIIIFIGTFLYATPTIIIESDKFLLEKFDVEYIINEKEDTTLEDIKKKDFKKAKSDLSLGIYNPYFWIRFKIQNKTDKKQTISLRNDFAFAAKKIDFYMINENKISKHLNIDFENDKNAKEKMFGSDTIFDIPLEKNEISTIYIKTIMPYTQAVNYSIYNKNYPKQDFISKNIYIIMILGMFLALTIYHLILFISSRYKEYLYYSLNLICMTIWNLEISGFLAHKFGIYYNGINDHLLSIMLGSSIFLTLFTKIIFNTKEKYKTEDKFLNSIIILSIILILISPFNLQFSLKVGLYFYIYEFVVLLTATYFIMKKGNPLALIFLIANGSFGILALFTDLYYLGFIPYSYATFYSATIGMLIEVFVLAYILSYKFRLLQLKELKQTKRLAKQEEIKKMNKLLEVKLKKELEKSKEKDKMIFQENKRASMGEMIENITHQWRQPLNQINSSVFVIDTYMQREKLEKELIFEQLDNIEKTTSYMSNTMDVFKNFFDKNKKKENFSLLTTIKDIKNILENSTKDIDIKINFKEKKRYFYSGYEDELKQVLMILINNAKDALETNKINNPFIKIEIKESNEYFNINVIDNAKGIKEEIIDKIFDPYFTTKHKAQGTGLGLYISKVIIEEHFLGKLNVKNIDNGACFTIELLKKINP